MPVKQTRGDDAAAEPIVVHRDTVRLRDLDARNHVNNSVYSAYVDDAILAWYGAVQRPRGDSVELVVTQMEIDFRSPIAIGERVQVALHFEHGDSANVRFRFEVRADDRVAAVGTRTLAGYDTERRVAAPVPERWFRPRPN